MRADDGTAGATDPGLVITAPHVHADAAALAGKERDTLRLAWEERRWTRRRVVTSAGRQAALALPTGSVLRPGEVIAVEADWYLVVEARPEPVLAVSPRDRAEAIRVAFEVGNRHFSLALDGDRLLVPDDTAMEQLLLRLGVRWERGQGVFDPLGGGGHRHAPEPRPPEDLAHGRVEPGGRHG
jgi:urease accessory protein